MSASRAGWRLTMLALGIALGSALAPAAHSASATTDFGLFVSEGERHEYQPLDPATLENRVGESALAFGFDHPSLAVSADGSTSVVIDPSQGSLEGWVSVRDGAFGPERLAIDTDAAIGSPRLSADGTRLVGAMGPYACGPSGCDARQLYLYDTVAGDLIAKTRIDLRRYIGVDLLAPDATRLYVPFVEGLPSPSHPATPTPPGISETGPWPLRIAAFDLTTGEETGRIAVPDIMAGDWPVEPVDGVYAGAFVMPALALSPDGRTIAVVDAAMETLTLIDAASLEVMATRAIHEPESAVSRVLRWLGVLPESAEAKVANGRSVDATFSADGKALYLTGEELEVGESADDFIGHGFGLLRVEVATGEITARALEGHHPWRVVSSPDGRSVYVVRAATPWWDSDEQQPTDVLQRLDAVTLETLAARDLGEWPDLLLVPAG
jgi:hypothetical protein